MLVDFFPLRFKLDASTDELINRMHQTLSYPVANWFELDNSQKPVKNFDIWQYGRLVIYEYFRIEEGEAFDIVETISSTYHADLEEGKTHRWLEIIQQRTGPERFLAMKLFIHTILIAFFNLENNEEN